MSRSVASFVAWSGVISKLNISSCRKNTFSTHPS